MIAETRADLERIIAEGGRPGLGIHVTEELLKELTSTPLIGGLNRDLGHGCYCKIDRRRNYPRQAELEAYSYLELRRNGWTDAELLEYGFRKVPTPEAFERSLKELCNGAISISPTRNAVIIELVPGRASPMISLEIKDKEHQARLTKIAERINLKLKTWEL